LFVGVIFTSNCFSAEDSNVGEPNLAIVCVSVANLRGAPSHSSELYDQELMGYPLTLQKKQDNWYKVETEYKYPGWMTEASFCKVSPEELKQWQECEKVRIVKVLATMHSEPNTSSEPITFVTMNALLKKIESQPNGWIKCKRPTENRLLKTQDCTDAAAKEIPKEQLPQSIVKTAKMMMAYHNLWAAEQAPPAIAPAFRQRSLKQTE
jgi:uncharacterized protein YgiM (DUF1202 family)